MENTKKKTSGTFPSLTSTSYPFPIKMPLGISSVKRNEKKCLTETNEFSRSQPLVFLRRLRRGLRNR